MNALLYKLLSSYGMSEVTGRDSNPEIIKMFASIGYNGIVTDETPWCSACLIYYCKLLHYEHPNNLLARSWLRVGYPILKPSLGDVVVLWSGSLSSWKGHVGLFISTTKELVYVLGGNQSNKINISAYDKYQVLGFRRLSKTPVT